MDNPFKQLDDRLRNIEIALQAISKQEDHYHGAGEDLLTVEEAADFLPLSKPTIYCKCSRNELPYMKRGKRVYFSKEELLLYLKQGRRKTIEELQNEASENIVNKKGGHRND